MSRVSLIDPEGRPELADLIGRIRGARGGVLLRLYKALLHAPALAETWFHHNNAVRWKTELGGRLREIVIVRIALLTRAEYVLRQHVPALTSREGLSDAECRALADWPASGFFDARERVALAYADAMTRDAVVPEPLFAEVRSHFTERQVIELTVLIGTYNMQARVMVALGLEPEAPAG